ncbi:MULTISPECIES: ribosomal protein S18-alanine N-acetyltransferase [Caproicibacterium]|jgi:ribosomal-protein-alanine N-acetyltransferase|uniref:Ribosomal-protein-alanine N-acetyltransferase n=1 Tax=Caproicibacterium lactatifermentans TaxID=2666138 RepID=A0A859DSW0_9FIRM|nr:ribosomal protein S18-alanine N-acetyltransferase [Caproicibacterium lactatifermentans]ARP51040.1 ribosomal-protein-alanine N-acetyltransferase [Ruminococcaceae bacterium CPB6]MDD4807396.1 ribosomal protein S18-alanine N-acetyltransferase [Oscillospiraceae bacterium]QKN23233.1 ribosomal-protein-alanine N-acetyltransferase [Caproicibacterium lactatifermentans]QKO30085.1 ribosomal-protein-alanine N-acetyltransferase [Caproicibacterium lactatifermentans]
MSILLKIVPMAEIHIAALAEIERLCFSAPWTEEGLRAELVCSTAVFQVALLEGIPVGYGGMHFVCGEGYIDNIAVLPSARRQGVGRRLVQTLLSYAESQNGAFVTLEVRESNLPALTLYRSLGFLPVGRRPHFYTHPEEAALLLTRRFLPKRPYFEGRNR